MKHRQGLAAVLPIATLFFAALASSSPDTSFDPLVPRRDVASEPAHPLVKGSLAADAKSTRPDVGTKDAPVDGLDGKPHAGPFVDPLDPLWHPPESSRQVQVSDNLKLGREDEKSQAGDGVMNDPHRLPPKKGTTGTEGGVSEKDRDRKIHEFSTGEKKLQTPDSPKAVVPLADREAGAPTTNKDTSSSKSAKALEKSSDSEFDDDDLELHGVPGLEKPTDLPEKPHNIPHPEPPSRTTESGSAAFAVSAPQSGKVRQDDEAAHDLIPWDSLAGSFSSIAATEIGDKTFIVAALMAMRHSRIQVFSAAFSALFIMTILSGLAGHAVGAIISKRWSALVAALLFLVFGAKSLREGFEMSPNQGVSDEIREVEAELEEKEVDMARYANGGRRTSAISPYALEAGRMNGRKSRSRTRMAAPRRSPSSSSSRTPSPSRPSIRSAVSGIKNLFSLLLSPAWVETFSMTFVGELGDRSQIATVAMAAGQEYFWVMVGASMGHFVCTGVAVLGGSVLAGRVSLRKVTLVGGAIFIGFGIFTLFEAAQYWL